MLKKQNKTSWSQQKRNSEPQERKVARRWERLRVGEGEKLGSGSYEASSPGFCQPLPHVLLGSAQKMDSRGLPWGYGFYCSSTTARRGQLSLFPVWRKSGQFFQ